MKYLFLVMWLLVAPFLFKQFDLLPYGSVNLPANSYINSWNGGLTIRLASWKFVSRVGSMPSFGRDFTLSNDDFLPQWAVEWLDKNNPNWREKIKRGEPVTIYVGAPEFREDI